MTIKPGAMVRIKGCHKVWKVVNISAGHDWDNAELYRRERVPVFACCVPATTIRQVWPVSMLELVAAAA